jgi:formate dehydrogenase subunit gamma
MTYAPWSKDEALLVLSQTRDKPGPVLISLQAIQSAFGFVPSPAVALVAEACNVSRAEVHGVLTFYSDLRTSALPANHVRVCVAEACQAVGSRELVSGLESQGVDFDEAFCFGNCALGPSATVNGKLQGRASADSVVKAIQG